MTISQEIITARCHIVLVSSGIELIFFPVDAVFWIWYEKNIDHTPMFSVAAKMSRTFFKLPMLG